MADGPGTSTETIDDAKRPAAVVVATVVGVFGLLASFIPGLFWVGWLLGAIAIAGSLGPLREGRSDPNHGMARIAFGAGALALLVGVLNLGITLDWFTYFTTDDAMPAS